MSQGSLFTSAVSAADLDGVDSLDCLACRRSLPKVDYTFRQGGQIRRTCRNCMRQHGRKVRLVRERLPERLDAQDHRCAACGDPLVVPHVDVNWERIWEPGSACFRGVICWRCNNVASHSGDDPARLRAVIAYLEAHRGEA